MSRPEHGGEARRLKRSEIGTFHGADTNNQGDEGK